LYDGQTGVEKVSVNFDQARGSVSDWGDDYGNRVDRFLSAVAYLDDSGLPSVVMARGYYTRTTLTAWNYRDGKLSQLWKFDSNSTPRDKNNKPLTGQGCHSMSVANVDADHGQEIIYGAMTIDHDGKGKCSTGFGHGDALHVTDLVLDRPGLEVFMPHEDTSQPAYDIHDANTCEVIFAGPVTGQDTGRGVAGDVAPGNAGGEMWAAGGTQLLRAMDGKGVGNTPASANFLVYWDGDESRELENATSITKYGGGTLLTCSQCAANNGTKSTPALVADIYGDWREEVIWREADNTALRIYTTTAVTQRLIYTLMHDPQYRVAVAWQNVAYNQPPHPSFHIGSGMAAPPQPDITVP
jgi:rhamnogalacturonan endolyase